MIETIKISDNLYIDSESFYEKVCLKRGVKTYTEDPNAEDSTSEE